MAIKKLITAVAAALGLAVAAPASAIIVGGIDFGPDGGAPLQQHLETSTLAETLINGVGQELRGYGVISTVNGNSSYCANGTNGCNLYYYFHGYTSTSFDPNYVTFTGGTIDLYFDNHSPKNLSSQDSNANVSFITGLAPWVQFTGHDFLDTFHGTTQTLNGGGFLTGPSLTVTGNGRADVNVGGFGLAVVQAFLNGNSEPDGLGGFADLTLNASSNNSVLNSHDVADGLATNCQTGDAQAGAWCLQGTLNTRGKTSLTVPEPATLALLGVGLIGLGFTQRKRWS